MGSVLEMVVNHVMLVQDCGSATVLGVADVDLSKNVAIISNFFRNSVPKSKWQARFIPFKNLMHKSCL